MSTVYVNRYTKAKELMEKNGGPTSFATRLGVTKQYISHILADGVGRKQIGGRFARKVEMEFSLPIGYLDMPEEAPSELDYNNLVVIKMKPNIALGDTRKAYDSIYKVEVFKNWLITNLSFNNFEDLALHIMQGNSMHPTFDDGAVLWMDTSESTINREGVYVVQIDNQTFVRRIDRGVDGSLRMVADNAKYREQIVGKDERHRVVVTGRVAYRWEGQKVS